MNEATATILVAGMVQVVGMVFGFLTLWVKLRHAGDKAAEAADKATVVEKKLDQNTATTMEIDKKADTIVGHTNGSLESMQQIVRMIADRVEKLEGYNHTSSHRLFDAINNVHLRLCAMQALPFDKEGAAHQTEHK